MGHTGVFLESEKNISTCVCTHTHEIKLSTYICNIPIMCDLSESSFINSKGKCDYISLSWF